MKKPAKSRRLKPAPTLPRYYFHGDRSEEDPNLIYCQAHDAFVAIGHFYEPDVHKWSNRSDYQRYSFMKRLFVKNGLNKEFSRPDNAANVFENPFWVVRCGDSPPE